MRTLAGILRPIHPWMIGLLRRSLLVTGLLFGFLLAGSAFAHAANGHPAPHPAPPGISTLGIGPIRLPDVPDVPALTKTVRSAKHTVKSVTKAVAPVTKAVAPVTNLVAPVTNVVTSLATDITTVVVRTTMPIVRPAMTMITPVLAPVHGPPRVRPRSPVETQSATPDPDLSPPVAVPVSAPAAGFDTASISVVPPQVLPAAAPFAPVRSSAGKLLPAPRPLLPPGGGDPIVDVMGGNSTCDPGSSGPMFGISRPFFGPTGARFADLRVRPGAGPPKWWFFDPRHHPS